jgi:hypothetical protein
MAPTSSGVYTAMLVVSFLSLMVGLAFTLIWQYIYYGCVFMIRIR